MIVYILIIAILLFSGAMYYYSYNGDNGDESGFNTLERCEDAGGIWREFPNTCVDSCPLARNPEVILCGQAFTFGCDCGEDMCWNGESCEKI